MRILLVYPNLTLVNTLPNSLGTMAACLKSHGHKVKLFDATLYRTSERINDEIRMMRMNVKRFDIDEFRSELKSTDIFKDFKQAVKSFSPDLIAITLLDDTKPLGLKLLSAAPDDIPVIAGGVHVTFNHEIIHNDNIDLICVGEGEKSLVQLANSENPLNTSINNIGYLNDDKIHINQFNDLADVNDLPYEDFSIFEKKRLKRPMEGRTVTALPLNLDRGCPMNCSFCAAPSIRRLYKNCGYFRTKSIERLREEIQYQLSEYPDINFLYFNSENFFARPLEELKQFRDMYKEFDIPFWTELSINLVNKEKVKILSEMNCIKISVGIEHGNEEFRKNMLHKRFTNGQVLDSFKLFREFNLEIGANNIIGFPDETRELVFDTIRLNRMANPDTINGFVFQPYYGTALREYAIEKGYLNPLDETNSLIGSSILNMGQFPAKEINNLLNTFVLYIRMPKDRWPEIKKAENNINLYNKLRNEYWEKYEEISFT